MPLFNLLWGTKVSWVETMIALSLADKTIVRQTRCSSRLLLMFRTRVNKRTQWGSERGSEYFSTHIHVEYVRPVCGGNTRSPRTKRFRHHKIESNKRNFKNKTHWAANYLNQFHLKWQCLAFQERLNWQIVAQYLASKDTQSLLQTCRIRQMEAECKSFAIWRERKDTSYLWSLYFDSKYKREDEKLIFTCNLLASSLILKSWS